MKYELVRKPSRKPLSNANMLPMQNAFKASFCTVRMFPAFLISEQPSLRPDEGPYLPLAAALHHLYHALSGAGRANQVWSANV